MWRFVFLFGLVALTAQPTNLWELTGRMNKFVEHYNLFVEELNAGAFDVAEARRLSKLWREVENSGMWPKGKK